MNTILVPLDGSPLADRILPYVQLLAPVLQARVHLLRAISPAEYHRLFVAGVDPTAGARSFIPPVCTACTMAMVCQDDDCALAQQAAGLRAAGVQAYADTRVGTAAGVIAATAEQWPCALIALATHARSGLRRWAHGSTADTLIHATSIPLLLVRGDRSAPTPDWAIRRIVVPLDGSALARQALPLAIELAIAAQAELILLQIAAQSVEEYMRAFPVASDVRHMLYEQLDQAVAGLASEMSQQPMRVSTAIGIGSATQAIAEEAARRHAGLIVMASQGYSGIERWRLGSPATQVLQATRTPLLLVRAQAPA